MRVKAYRYNGLTMFVTAKWAFRRFLWMMMVGSHPEVIVVMDQPLSQEVWQNVSKDVLRYFNGMSDRKVSEDGCSIRITAARGYIGASVRRSIVDIVDSKALDLDRPLAA